MSLDRFPVGLEMDVSYPEFTVSLRLLSTTQLAFEIRQGPFARAEVVDIHVVSLGNALFAVSWQEQDGATVSQVQDFDRQLVYSCATLADGRLLRMIGTVTVTRPSAVAQDHRPLHNKALLLAAMASRCPRRDASAAGRLHAHDDIGHNARIPQGRDALQALAAGLPDAVHYEPGLVVAIHGRLHGWRATPQVVVDLFRIENGLLAEHWNALQEELPAAAARAGTAMFDADAVARPR